MEIPLEVGIKKSPFCPAMAGNRGSFVISPHGLIALAVLMIPAGEQKDSLLGPPGPYVAQILFSTVNPSSVTPPQKRTVRVKEPRCTLLGIVKSTVGKPLVSISPGIAFGLGIGTPLKSKNELSATISLGL